MPPRKKKTEETSPDDQSERKENVVITAPKFRFAKFRARGITPLVTNAFSVSTFERMRAEMEEGKSSKSKKNREPRDFDKMYEESKHISREGWCGFPAAAIRNACISACRLVDYKMTLAKLSITVRADGFDRVSGQPLIRITKGEPHKVESLVRLKSGVPDIHARAMWDEGWEATLQIRYDSDQFSPTAVANLIMRVGAQCGIMEGRNDSPDSPGCGWGEFEIVSDEEDAMLLSSDNKEEMARQSV